MQLFVHIFEFFLLSVKYSQQKKNNAPINGKGRGGGRKNWRRFSKVTENLKKFILSFRISYFG